MGKFAAFCRVAADYSPFADFLTIYINEAHPVEGWTFKNNIAIGRHRTIDDRIAAARLLVDQRPPFPVVVDSMADEGNYAYGVLYERLYVIIDGTVVFQGGRGPRYYFIDEVEQWLKNYTNKHSIEIHK
ncbi:hypothetical protein LSH36_294g03016 [Paralvinella palmiformis]|uniref:Iodothyronine deiodinase n=1 Tax=Paralvinella palmiformis TaxID=53620 RepID=A0AAD9JJU2_9ANNE|nr:hypothetical protein LSH36_294g03016 [Paralvinella palmiformis]